MRNNNLAFAIALASLLFLSFSTPILYAQSDQTVGDDEQIAEQHQEAVARLNDIEQSLTDKRQQIKDLQQQLEATTQESDQAELQQQIEKANNELKELSQSFEQIAIGGIDVDEFTEEAPQEFNWQQELIQISRPILDSLKDLTEKPRKIEKLRSDISRFEDRLQTIDQALVSMAARERDTLSPAAAERLRLIAEDWQQRKTDSERALEVARYQLANLQGQNVSWLETLGSTTSEFLYGRGLTLLIALVAATAVWLLMRSLLWIYQYKIISPGQRRHSTRVRLAVYSYSVFKVLLMTLAVLLVFYFRGDLLLLALSIFALVFVFLSFKQMLPAYIDEIRLLLNLGPVRHGERVVYNGLPMEVRTINMYSILRNPDLEGIVRLPLAELGNLISRPSGKDELWFPCHLNEYLLLPDGTLGQILRQTLETVTVKSVGSIAYYSSADFLHCNARNLSRQGYGVAVTFGIDYQHQTISLDQVPAVLQDGVMEKFEQAGLIDDVENIMVDFKEAGASSLDYLIIVNMSGSAAASYFRIGRLIQQSCVAVCNREGWVIPFNQITVHQGEGFEFASLSTPRHEPAVRPIMIESS